MASPSVASTTASTTDTSKRKLPAGSSDAIHPATGKRPAGGNPRVRILHIHFSDGIEQLQSGSNGPSAEALNEANGAPSYMRPIARLEKKEVEWLRILAEGLINSSEDSSLKKDLKDGKLFFLSQLPHGYRLFEQIRHAGATGGKGRKDTYLYGHPKGPHKRYRSPADFLVHLKWLASDQNNPTNCACSACKGGGGAAVGALSPQATPLPVPMPAAVPLPAPSTATPQAHHPSQAAPNHQTAPAPAPAAVVGGIVLSSTVQQEKQHDMLFPALAIYRLGEQVWFQTGPHWAIGVVIGVPAGTNSYRIQPLQSPLLCEQSASHNNIPPAQLRPWVAWSTPPVTSKKLETANRVAYEDLPWEQESGTISLEVDASILKSRDVDISYTLLDKLTAQHHYSGVYYGAERFWVGDAVRIKASAHPSFSSDREIMIVSSIQDAAPNTVSGARNRESGVVVTGDVYRLGNHALSIPPPPGLPSAVIGDLAARAKFSVVDPASPYWVCSPISAGLTVRLEEIKGRWYPGSSLFRIVHGLERFRDLASTSSISSEEWDATGSRMNEMGTGGSGATLGWRRYQHRHQAFHKAIPAQLNFTPPPVAAAAAAAAAATPAPTPPPLAQEGAASASSGAVENGIPALRPLQSLGPHDHQQTVELDPGSNTTSKPIDLTGGDGEGDGHGNGDDGMEFIADHDSVDEEFMKQMGEDAASFLAPDDGDFYGAL